MATAVDDLVPGTQADAELDKAMVEEGNAGLDPVGHAVAVFPVQQHREV